MIVLRNNEKELIIPDYGIRFTSLEVIQHFKDFLINALKARNDSHFELLSHHQDSIISNDGNFVEYVRKDKTVGVFSVAEYEALETAIKALEKEEYIALPDECWAPLFESIPWVQRPEDEPGKPKFSDLLRVVRESVQYVAYQQGAYHSGRRA